MSDLSPRHEPLLSPFKVDYTKPSIIGFGGTNAHAIMESYEPPPSAMDTTSTTAPAVLPLTFSAASEATLLQLLTKYTSFLESEPGAAVDIGDLGYTLTCRRSALPHKISFAASTVPKLQGAIKAFLDQQPMPKIGRTTAEAGTNYLGIFTGQGAQWAQMGAKLLAASPVALDIVSRLEAATAGLPEASHRPKWSLRQELCAAADKSRITEAAISQPLCTAVQIILVDLLTLSNIRFSAVVGHSSGEIGAAYAAGFLSATDAYLVAYYRGRCCSENNLSTAIGADGTKVKGSMIAVATSVEDAEDLCGAEDMQGRITIAAINSSTSVTLSGDESAILEAEEVFKSEGKFCRVLRVDQAYHSHHMLAAAGPYRDCLAKCGIQVRRPPHGAPVWFSSVRETENVMQYCEGNDLQDLAHDYWARNLTSPVLFSGAITAAVSSTSLSLSLDVVLEVGPHPVLKGPATSVIREATGKNSSLADSYFGTLKRGNNDVESLAEMLGNLWVLRGPAPLQSKAYQAAFVMSSPSTTEAGPGQREARFATDLPTYAWDHSKGYWAEARTTSNLLKEKGQYFHDLLGSKCPDGNDGEWRWYNLLRLDEIPWLQGHSLQGQVVFPTTGYIAMALEASKQIADAIKENSRIQLIEITELDIARGLAIQATGSEVGISMTGVSRRKDSRGMNTISCRFTCYSALSGKDSHAMVTNCTGQVLITLGETIPDILAPRQSPVGLRPVDVQEFNDELALLGYGYQAPWFRGIRSLERKLDQAAGTVAGPLQWKHENEDGKEEELEVTSLMLHPGLLDSVLQGLFAAYSHPGDERLWTIHAPTKVARLAIVPGLCASGSSRLGEENEVFAFDSFCTDATMRGRIVGDIDLYTTGYKHKMVEIQGLTIVPLSPFTSLNDRCLFANSRWYPERPSGPRAVHSYRLSESDILKNGIVERIALYYLRVSRDVLHQAAKSATASQEVFAPARMAAMRWNDHVVEQVSQGKHEFLQKEWLHDTKETVAALIDEYKLDGCADMALLQAVGENLPTVIEAGDKGNIIEYMVADGKLTRFYTKGICMLEANAWSADMALQLAERYPQMNILEIGAGTGGTTRGILGALGPAFATYTYTDISAGFFPDAQATFSAAGSPYQGRLIYKTLDIEEPVTSQGFEANSYDLVVASNVLHATADIGDTLRNVRSLLKPGGYLLMVEIIDLLAIRIAVIYSGTPGWWVGAETGRPWGPTISLSEWDALLKLSGFAGVETSTPLLHPIANSTSVFFARAVDDDFRLLLDPLQLGPSASLPPATIHADSSNGDGDHSQQQSHLILVGTAVGPNATRMAQEFRALAVGPGKPWQDSQVLMVETIEQLETALGSLPPVDTDIGADCTTLALGELDERMFESLTSSGWNGLRKLLARSSTALWLTVGATDGTEPYSSMILGWLRSIVYEYRDCYFQSLDVGHSAGDSSSCPAAIVAETLLRLRLQREWSQPGAKKANEMLWSWELELAWDIQLGGFKVMRLKPDDDRNNRYNSIHRRILAPPPRNANSTVRLDWQHDGSTGRSDGYWTVKADHSAAAAAAADELIIDTEFSVLNAFKTPNAGSLFLVLGRAVDEEERVSNDLYLCLTTKHASRITVKRNTHALPVSPDAAIYQPYLSFATAYLLSSRLLELVPAYATVVIHEADTVLAALFANKAEQAKKHIKVLFTTSTPFKRWRKNWIYIHPHAPKRTLDTLLPRDTSFFIYLGAGGDTGPLAKRVARSLPKSCAQHDATSLLSSTASASVLEKETSVIDLLKGADEFAMDLLYEVTDNMPLGVSMLSDIVSSPSDVSRKLDVRLICWRARLDDKDEADGESDAGIVAAANEPVPSSVSSTPIAEVNVEVEPADRSHGGPRALFRSNSIYWLVGLAGDMGRSFCDWMMLHGARHIIFSSRDPKLPEDWIADHTAKGNRIGVVKMDVTSLADVQRAKAEICASCAPNVIAGVVTGAMIIRDVPMADMDYTTLQEVLRPKVEGTRNLDAVFSADAELDWFIALSSFIADTGNFGQLAYAAGNCFQKALIRQRRCRGLPSASIDIAQVVGVGYVTREKATGRLDKHMSERLLKRSGIQPVSEVDLHTMFAEAVLASSVGMRAGLGAGLGNDSDGEAYDVADIITGPTRVTTHQATNEIMSAWAQNPRFAHYICDADPAAAAAGENGNNGDSNSRVPLKTRLLDVSGQEEAFDMIKSMFLCSLSCALFFSFLVPFSRRLFYSVSLC